MSKLSKGKRIEREVANILRQMDYAIYKPIHTRYGAKDIFGLFDIIAVKSKDSISKFPDLFLIQVKTNKTDYYSAKGKIKRWLEEYKLPKSVGVGVWLRESKSHHKIYIIHEGKEYVKKWVIVDDTFNN